MNQESLKKLVGNAAVKYIHDGMTVGLGTGSTVKYLVEALGQRVKEEHLNIIGVPTSNRTAKRAKNVGITIKGVDEVDHIDLTIDGADQVDENFQGIKGGGIAHLREKIVATNSKKNIWIVDETKMTKKLGNCPLPVEVIPYGSKQLFKKLAKRNYHPKFRMAGDSYVLTHAQNYIIDLNFTTIEHPHRLARDLEMMTGVVEHGLFLDLVNTVIVGEESGIHTFHAR